MQHTAPTTRYKTASEERNGRISLDGKFAQEETILPATITIAEFTKTADGTENPSADLNITAIGINSRQLETRPSRRVDVGRAIVFKVSGGTAGVTYLLLVTADTSQGQTAVKGRAYLTVTTD